MEFCVRAFFTPWNSKLELLLLFSPFSSSSSSSIFCLFCCCWRFFLFARRQRLRRLVIDGVGLCTQIIRKEGERERRRRKRETCARQYRNIVVPSSFEVWSSFLIRRSSFHKVDSPVTGLRHTLLPLSLSHSLTHTHCAVIFQIPAADGLIR